MFKFDEYPEIKEAHEMYERLSNQFYKAEQKYDKSNSVKAYDEWGNKIKSASDFKHGPYAEIIYRVFSKIKPSLVYIRTREKTSWDQLFENKSEKDLDEKQRKILSMMIEEERPYRLPDEYYDERDWYEEVKNRR